MMSDENTDTEEIEVFICNECGWVCRAEDESNIGYAHAHAEKHTGFFSFANVDKLNSIIDKKTFHEAREDE